MTATAMLPRLTAYGLDTPVAEALDWRRLAACRGDWERFDAWLPTQYDVQARLIHTCRRHCPVLAQCQDYTALYPQTNGVVQAGAVWNNGRKAELADPGCGNHCEHLRRGHGRS